MTKLKALQIMRKDKKIQLRVSKTEYDRISQLAEIAGMELQLNVSMSEAILRIVNHCFLHHSPLDSGLLYRYFQTDFGDMLQENLKTGEIKRLQNWA